MKNTKIVLSIAWISVLILGLVLTACSGNEIVYYEETKILNEEEADNIAEVTENRTRIVFKENTPFVAGIKPGDVLVYEHPVPGAEYGLLERVTSVSTMGSGFVEGATGLTNGGTVVEIEPATLEDAIEQGVISVNTTVPQEDLMSDTLWTTGVEVLQAEEGYQFSYSPIEGVTIEGHLLVTADAEIYIEAGFFSGLEEFKFIFSPGLEMEVDLTVDESVSWDEKYTIAEIPGPPIPIWGPVTITPSIELVVGTDGEITGLLEAGVAYERIYDVGVRYYDGTWSTISEMRGDGATLEPPSFNGQAEAKVYAGTVLSGTAGVSYVAEAALQTEMLGNIRATGEIETSPWRWQYDLEMYLTAQVFADLDLCRIAHVGWDSDVWQYPDLPYNLAYGASGRVTVEGGEGLDGVQIDFSGGYSSVTTDSDGYWSKHLLTGDVVATPERIGYTFDPPNITIAGSASALDFQAFVEVPELEWSKTLGGVESESPYCSVQQTLDGGYIIAGSTESYGAGLLDAWLIKTDSSGNKVWDKTFGGTEYDGALSVQQTSDGGYIIAGLTESYGAGSEDVWLIKTDSSGNKVWDKTFGGTGHEVAWSVQQTSDNGYIIAGTITPYEVGEAAIWLIKTDSSGNKVWDKTFGGLDWEVPCSVRQTSDYGYVIVGSEDCEGTCAAHVWLIKTDSSGNKVWDKTFGGTEEDIAYSVEQTSDDGYIIAGVKDTWEPDVLLIKTDSSGNKVWDKTFGGTGSEGAAAVQQTSDGGYILAGGTETYGAGSMDVWLIKTDSSGNKVWDKTFGGTEDEWAFSVEQTSDGGYILAGGTESYGAGDSDIWLLKVG